MNEAQIRFQAEWAGPANEDFFAGLEALAETPATAAAPIRVQAPRGPQLAAIESGSARRAQERQARNAAALSSYLAAVEHFARRYVAFPSEHEPVAVALWVAHTHYIDQLDVSPILAVTSAEMRSGKTRVLDVLELHVPNAERAVLPSESVVYTLLSQDPRPTLLIDEADAIFSTRRQAERYEGVRAVLNAGHRRGTTVPRVRLEGKHRGVDRFDAFGPKAIAGIGKLPDTVADRAIPIRLKRRAPGEMVARFRRRQAEAEAAAIPQPPPLGTLVTDVTVPEELNDRAADSWEPLIALADAAGGTWPARARLAAIAVSSAEDDQVTTGIRLLGDVRDVFGDADHLPTAELLSRLHELEDGPWGDWYGRPLTARALADLLEPYRIHPTLRRLGGERRRGYFRAELGDAWRRYLPPEQTVPTVTSVPAGTGGTGVTVPEGLFDPEHATDDDGEVSA